MRSVLVLAFAIALTACGTGDGTEPEGGAGGVGDGGAGGAPVDPDANPDGDCLTNAEEELLGTNRDAADTDADGMDDCVERDCLSDPLDSAQKCYACGWKRNDPGTLVSNGSSEGDVVANMDLIDQCQEPVKLWDFAGEYHILFMTAAW